MGKVIDLTDKLGLGGRPEIAIGGERFEVNDSASAVLGIMDVMGDGDEASPKDVLDVYGLLFDAKARKRLDALNLSFADFQEVVFAAVDLAVGGVEDEGNAPTPATT